MINNRQNGRRRGRGGGGQRPQGNPGRPDGGGSRIDNRARGNAQQLHEKYKNLARDSQMAGDRVTTEYYLQFADHYFRVLSESRARFEDQRPQRDDNDDDFDGNDDFDQQQGGNRQDGNRDQQQQPRGEQQQQRREGRRQDYDRQNDREDRGNQRRDEQPQPRREQPAYEANENQAQEAPRQGDDEQRRERRPRRPRREESAAPVEAIEADRLPPAIAIEPAAEEAPAAPKRRTRRPRVETANDTVEVPPAA